MFLVFPGPLCNQLGVILRKPIWPPESQTSLASSLSFARSFPTFTALQPFVLVLWSDQANCPLFMGRVTQP